MGLQLRGCYETENSYRGNHAGTLGLVCGRDYESAESESTN